MSAFEDKRLLIRYWVNWPGLFGFGVTAYSVEDALDLLADEGFDLGENPEMISDIDIRTIDQNHIACNIGPVCFRGVWYPCFNLSGLSQREKRRLRTVEGRIQPQPPWVCRISIG